ncbi:alpha/beta hydrolase family protein [Gluconobacter aidae]|uniref:Biotin synthase n=1 Tax=Gluconobacter aidae TaxID=2662454 RepID=A0A7X1VMW8_9PROT|nr:biotin synthase [Gluconobacter aidae]MQR99118.1 biotin synthase [Gluconobacter aidae]
MTRALYLVHGWGFDASFWTPMLARLPDVNAQVVDCGYFGSGHRPALPETPYLAVGHSAGSLALLGQDLPGCAGLVFFNGFPRFTAASDFPDGTPERLLTRMRARLKRDPVAVLHDFRALCGTDAPLPGTPDGNALDRGLEALQQQDHRVKAAGWGNRLHWMTGTDDPFGAAQAGFASPGERVAGGHLLPLTRPGSCAALVRRRLDDAG